MKKSVLFLVLIFVLTACDHARNYEEIKQDSKECVLDFIKAVNDNKDRFDDGDLNPFIIATRNNPHWDPLKVEFEEDVDTIVEKNGVLDYVIVHAKHQGVAAKFKVYFLKEYSLNQYSLNDEFKGRAGKPNIRETFNFINFDFAKYKKENGFEIIRKADSDVHFAYLCNKATKAVETVKKYIGSIKSGHKGTTYYPSSNKLPLKADSLLYTAKVKSITISNNNIYNICYTNDVIFYVQIDIWNEDFTITNSLGLYPFEEKLRLFNEKHHTNLELQRPNTDAGCIAALQRAESNIQDEIARQKAEAYKKERMAYWERVGLVITNVEMTSGTDKDGDNTKGIKFRVFNPTKKSIKYVIAEIVAVNRVGDKMSYPQRCRGIGPIEPQESGEYEFEDVFVDRNDVIDDLSVGFQVVYMNGGSKNIRLIDASTEKHDFNLFWW